MWPNTELFLVLIFCIRPEYGDLNFCIQSEYKKIRTRNNSEFGHFSRSARIDCGFKSMWLSCNWIAQTIWECQMSISIKYLHVILFIEKIEAVVQKYSVRKVFLNILQSSQETPEPEACNFIKHEALVQVFSCRFCDMFKKTFFTEYFRTTASLSYSLKRYFPENFPSFAEQLSEAIIRDQVYSNTRVPTQVNTSQHESTRVWHESTRINTNQHESDTSTNTSQHESTRINTSLTRVNTNQHDSTRVRHEPTRVRLKSTRINTSQKVS